MYSTASMLRTMELILGLRPMSQFDAAATPMYNAFSAKPNFAEYTHAVPDARGPQWTKVVFNAATSALAALTGLTVGQVCTDAGLRHEVDRLIAEARAVCAAAGIALTRDPAEAVEEAIREAFGHKPSMLQDVLARRPTEIGVLNGGIAAEGRRVGVATPAHDAMVALVRGLERSWDGVPPAG